MTGLGDPGFFAGEPDAALAGLRRSPVRFDPDRQWWVVARHGDVIDMSRDPVRFCSSRGVLPGDRARGLSPEDSLLYLDPPRHVQYRQLVSRAFTPRRVAALEPRVRALTRDLLDAIDPHRPTDLVDALTAPLPLAVIAELLGLPAGDRDDFRRWSDAIMEAATVITDENTLAALELIDYLEGQLRARRQAPTPDLLTALLQAEVGGERLTPGELIGFCMTLLVAGNETTRAMLTGGLVALAEHPDQRRRLVEEPDALPGAVEEMLRWVSPIMAMARTTTEPVTVGGCPVPPDQFVVMLYGAANRDEDVFGPRAGVFDAFRTHNPHLAFGFGEHFCIGAPLARLEGRVVVSEVLARWPWYQLAGPVVRAPSTLLRQVAAVPVVFAP